MKCATSRTWKQKERDKGRASRTPGKDKGPTCSLTPIGGQPRKFWTSSKAYKHKRYCDWIEFSNLAHGVKQ